MLPCKSVSLCSNDVQVPTGCGELRRDPVILVPDSGPTDNILKINNDCSQGESFASVEEQVSVSKRDGDNILYIKMNICLHFLEIIKMVLVSLVQLVGQCIIYIRSGVRTLTTTKK